MSMLLLRSGWRFFMLYSRPSFEENDDDLRIIHEALVLKWASLTKQIEASQNKENIKSFCQLLIRTIEMIQSMEEVGF